MDNSTALPGIKHIKKETPVGKILGKASLYLILLVGAVIFIFPFFVCPILRFCHIYSSGKIIKSVDQINQSNRLDQSIDQVNQITSIDQIDQSD